MQYYGHKINYDAEACVYYADVYDHSVEDEKLQNVKSIVCALVISEGDLNFAYEMKGLDEEEIENIYDRYLNFEHEED